MTPGDPRPCVVCGAPDGLQDTPCPRAAAGGLCLYDPVVTECPHLDYVANVDINRLMDPTETTMVGLSVEVTAKCLGCDAPVVFHCNTVGWSSSTPAVSPTGQELRAPARLAVHPADFGLQLPGFTVTAHAPTSPN